MKYPMARWAVCLFLVIVQGGAWAGEPGPELRLKDGDVVAVCGDSITSAGTYPLFMEIYGLVCGPKLDLTFVNCGRWGQNAGDFPKSWDVDFVPAKPTVMTVCYGMNVGRWGGVLSAGTLAKEAGALKALIEKFKAGGGRVAVLGSPGCVDTEFHSKPEGANRNLAQLRDNARTVAGETGAVFADVHASMVDVMTKAKEKYGKEFEAAAIEKGVNLAAEFIENPFREPVAKILTAMDERNRCRRWLANKYKGDAGMQKRLEQALENMKVVPVKHTLKIEPVR